MAEEELAEIEEEEAPKKTKLKLILIGLLVLITLGGGGYFAYIKFLQPAPSPEEEGGGESQLEEETQSAGKKSAAPIALGVMVPLEPFIVNLADSKGKRFLKVAITLELSSPEVSAEINENVQKITDSILILLSSKTFTDVYSVQGNF